MIRKVITACGGAGLLAFIIAVSVAFVSITLIVPGFSSYMTITEMRQPAEAGSVLSLPEQYCRQYRR